MNQKIFNNLILLFIIFFIIKTVSPEPDSILFILKKYVNYFSFQIKKFLGLLQRNEQFINMTANGSPHNTELIKISTLPNQINFVNYYKLKNTKINEIEINNIYEHIQTLVIPDVYNTYLNSSDIKPNSFTDSELNKIKDILLTRLNYSKKNFSFYNFTFENKPKYYLNIYGKEIDPFTFRIDSSIGELRIYIDIDIRNDVYSDKDFIVINEIKPLRDNQVINSYKNVNKSKFDIEQNVVSFVGTQDTRVHLKHNNINLNEIIYNEDEFQNTDNNIIAEFDNQNEIIY